ARQKKESRSAIAALLTVRPNPSRPAVLLKRRLDESCHDSHGRLFELRRDPLVDLAGRAVVSVTDEHGHRFHVGAGLGLPGDVAVPEAVDGDVVAETQLLPDL